MRPGNNPDFEEMLATLNRHGVEYIVVGGVGAAMQGSPLNTFDLDLVQSHQSDNLPKLLAALNELHARYRLKPELSPTIEHLAGNGHPLLLTDYGSLDVRGMIGRDWNFDRLLPFCKVVDMEGVGPVRVLELGKLIEVKEETAGDKDRAQLPILKQVLREIESRGKA